MFLKKITFVLLTLFFYQVQAQERILNFDVKIQIEKSGEIHVIENITIKAEGHVFQHGLLRALPLSRNDKNGNQIDVKYSIDSIRKNGSDEPYFTKEEGGTWKIYIGDKDIDLASGIYKYQISYHVPFQIGYFDNYDELYWNVTGNNWNFSIDKATCEIFLPSENNTFKNLHCYSGREGSTASNCISTLNESKTVVTFAAVHLEANEGLTVAASFPKGITDPPTFTEKSSSFYKQIKTNLWSAIFGIGMAFFFFINWKRYGKDPVRKTIIPEFSPPFDWSPALVGYVYHRKLEDRTYMASLINSAVKGALKISSDIEEGIFVNTKKYEIEVLDTQSKSLSPEESGIVGSFSKKVKVKVEDSNYKIFENAYSKWTKAVEKQIKLEEVYLNNTRLKWIGLAVLLIAGLAFEVLSKNGGNFNYRFYAGLICSLTALTYWFTQEVEGTGLLFLRGILAFFIYPMAVGIFLMSIAFLDTTQIITIAVVVLLYIIYIINLGKFTEKGAEAVQRLEGFKLYLETAEKDRMNLLNPPELTPQLFEKLLPYAIALGVEIKWGKQFEEILELAKYNPDWYQGSDTFYSHPTVFVSSFGNSVQNARVDPTPSSSSSSSGSSGSWSSGSSGGGSSGGGGGGGGGGGW